MSLQSRILGIDYGTRRLGVAVSDPLGIIATGVAVIMNSREMFSEINRIVQKYDAKTIVVGMPFNLKGERGSKAVEVGEFMEELRAATKCEVVEWDERFTSHTALETMQVMGMKKKQRQSKSMVDLMASALILQGYLDSRKS